MGNSFPLKAFRRGKVVTISDDNISLPDYPPLGSGDPLRVTELVMTRASLRTIPFQSNIWCLVNVTKIDLSWNELEEIPLLISRLSHLEILNLSHNKLKAYPAFMCGFKKLISLDLSFNEIEHLEENILLLARLKTLKMEGNANLIWPSKEVCACGKDAIFTEILQRKKEQQNLWKNWKPYYRRDNGVNRTLVEICINVILDCHVDYLKLDSVPPMVKNYLHEAEKYDKPSINLSKCSRCKGFFTNEAIFNTHICKVPPRNQCSNYNS